MIDTAYLKKLAAELAQGSKRRTEVIVLSNEALYASKRAIFALHRLDVTAARALLNGARATFVRLKAAHGEKIDDEGAYRAALEEYVEAELFMQFITEKKLGRIAGIRMSAPIYFAGLCDLIGEIARATLHAATERDERLIERAAKSADTLFETLIACDVTGYLRTKFDQAKQHFRRIEEIVYEYAIRNSR